MCGRERERVWEKVSAGGKESTRYSERRKEEK